ncbi:MAG: prepilin-type N-terminal cleavage/methylation domain-containing protein [Patescibacteria group bacterium]
MKTAPRGITLMELLVVMGIFSLTVALTSSIFLLSNQAQRRVLAITAAQADLRFTLESIVREVRAGSIDYETYEAAGGIQAPSLNLIIRSASGSRLEFYKETNPSICPAGVAGCLAVRVDGVAQSVTSSGILLENLAFFITPQADPFSIDEDSGLYKADAQPTVTLALKVRTQGRRPEDIVTLNAQTTIAARSYVR